MRMTLIHHWISTIKYPPWIITLCFKTCFVVETQRFFGADTQMNQRAKGTKNTYVVFKFKLSYDVG